MQWRGEAVLSKSVSERAFYVERAGEQIPGILWMPEESDTGLPLVLIGHGGQSEKRNPAGLALARRFVRRHGLAVCAIDAIDHGDRGDIRNTGDPAGHPSYRALWKREDTFDRMNADWSATLDAVITTGRVDQERVGYWGLSMGTMLGLPFVASESRIRSAVLGVCGFSGPSAVRGRLGDRHRADAAKITCPVMFMMQWDDEIFDRDGVLDMFDALGSEDKRLHVHPGRHGAFPLEAADATREFLAARLRGDR